MNCVYCGRKVSGDHDTYCVCGNCKGDGEQFNLRDFFAGCALPTIMADRVGQPEELVAEEAYRVADTMMKTREQSAS